MQVNSINNCGCNSPKRMFLASKGVEEPTQAPQQPQQVNFTGDDKKSRNAMRNAVVALCFLPVAGGMVTSCDKDDAYAYAYAEANANANANASILDTTKYCHCKDTVYKWYYAFQRPIPLDTLYKNLDNWDIDGTDGNMNDSTSKRNIIHYEGQREWEYNSKEIGDINLPESSKNILVYDTEILDYKGNHESYGKRVIRIPSGNYTVTTKNGKTLHNPKGVFVEEYKADTDKKYSSIFDCALVSRDFCQTNGDTLRVAKRDGTSNYVEKGSAAKGYLGNNSILLRNLIGQYSTDDHYVNFNVKAISDNDLRKMYVGQMDNVKTCGE